MICMGSRGLWSNDGMLQIKMCATNSKTRMLCTNHKRCSTEDLWNHNFPFCFWVMAKTISFQNIMIITLKLSYYISGLFYFSSAWILNLWTKRLFLSHSLWLLNARNFEFKLMFVSDIIKFPQGISEISVFSAPTFAVLPQQVMIKGKAPRIGAKFPWQYIIKIHHGCCHLYIISDGIIVIYFSISFSSSLFSFVFDSLWHGHEPIKNPCISNISPHRC